MLINRMMLLLTLAAPAAARTVDQTAGQQAMPGMTMPGMTIPVGPADAPAAMDHGDMAMSDMAMPGMAMPGMTMTGALGGYPVTREASGTSWQPDAERHAGLHVASGDWMLMGHALVNLVHTEQGGPRGGGKTFVGGMVMVMARRPVGDGTLQFRLMLSPEPLMGKSGYPLLLASGETADGRTQLTDRQHPHDLFMEMSVSLSQPIAAGTSLFLYAGLPGEPAFGPPAFMHRAAIMDSPEAPISHHWLDSTHITWGVVTAGVVHGNWKLEGSRFKGREPDQYRYDIETPRFDSTALRLSWNPVPEIALQASWARLKSPEQLEPLTDQTRWSASALFAYRLGESRWSSTLAWGRRIAHEPGETRPALDAFVAETSLRLPTGWTLFGRGEITENDELLVPVGEVHGDPFSVGKASLGVIRDVPIGPNRAIGIGIQAAYNVVPQGLSAAYGGNRWGGMAFLRLRIG